MVISGEQDQMQATLDIPAVAPPRISQADDQRMADRYLTTTLGSDYQAVSGTAKNARKQRERWNFCRMS